MNDERLDHLFRAYREACEVRDHSPGFMPGLWQKIDKAQGVSFAFRRWAKGFVTAAAVLSMTLALVAFHPRFQSPALPNSTYVEALAATNAPDGAEFLETGHPDSWDDVELL